MPAFGGVNWIRQKLSPAEQDAYYKTKLKQWKKGQSGNPNGRPRRESIASKLTRYGDLPATIAMLKKLDKTFPGIVDQVDVTVDDVIWLNLMLAATENNQTAISFISDKQEGSSSQHIEITNKQSITGELTESKKELIRETIRKLKEQPNA